MSGRRLFALALLIALVAAAMLPSGGRASGSKTVVPLDGRFGGRCPAGNKDLAHCHDVMVPDSTGKTADTRFQLEKTYCSVITTEQAGSWKYFPTLKRVNGVYRYAWVYKATGTTGTYDAVSIKFTLSGHFTTPKRFVLTVVGKVTQAADEAKDCANVRFTEQHVLNYVTY